MSEDVARLRGEVKKLLEWQRQHGHAGHTVDSEDVQQVQNTSSKPSIDVTYALSPAFTVLLSRNDGDHPANTTASSDAFQILSMVAQLDGIHLSEEAQTQLAEILYQHWFTSTPSINCRSLLEVVLARRSWQNDNTNETAVFVEKLLSILQQTFSVGNKRSLQILVHVFNAANDEQLKSTFPDLEAKLAECISTQTGAQQSAKLLAKLLLRRYKSDPEHITNLLKPLVSQETQIARQAVFENLLPPVLSQVPEVQAPLLEWLRSQSKSSDTHLLAYLSLARLSVLNSISPQDRPNDTEYDELIASSLVHEEPSIRFEAVRLLSSLPAGTGPSRRFNLHHLDLHALFWKYNLTDSDSPAVRTGLVGVWKDFIIRARLSCNAAQKIVDKDKKRVRTPSTNDAPSNAAEAQSYICAIESFFQIWIQNAVVQLLPVKPYRCHFSALLFLQILLDQAVDHRYLPTAIGNTRIKSTASKDIISWPFSLDIVSPTLIDRLITCIRSTYDDIRSLSYTLLASISLDAAQSKVIHDLGFLLVNRKRDAEISSGTLYLRLASLQDLPVSKTIIPTLLDLLEERLERFHISFADAAETYPVHGILQAIASLLDSVDTTIALPNERHAIFERCVKAIYDIWQLTSQVLCRDLETEDADEQSAEDSSEQVILNASWRAIKEASNLLSVVLADSKLWKEEVLSKHASLFATWLLEIGHRGVFAHVSQAYGRLCTMLVRSKDGPADLPAVWLHRHLSDIIDIERPLKRRSAGLPYLLLGALSGFSAHNPAQQHAFQRLFDALSPESPVSDVTKTHVIHSLRVLLQDGKLSTATKSYVQKAFSVAISGFGSEHWGVRNASLLLYAALITRVFGNKKENRLPLARRISIVEFFSQYEGLVPDLVGALASGLGQTGPEALGSVFAVLLLLSLLVTRSTTPKATSFVDAFYPLVDTCAGSPVWKVRDTAAAALTGLIPESDIFEACRAILQRCTQACSYNELHGRLLQVHALLSNAPSTTQNDQDTQRSWNDLLGMLDTAVQGDCPLPILTQMLEIVALAPGDLPDSLCGKLHSLACRHYGHRRPGHETYMTALASALLKTEAGRYVEKLLACQSPAAQAEALAYLEVHPDLQQQDTVQRALLAMASGPDTATTNRVTASVQLARYPHELEESTISQLARQYRLITVPAVKQSLLPLLAESPGLLETDGESDFIWNEIQELGCDESSVAREAACFALAVHKRRSDVFDFAYGQQILRFLQDDDMAIRRRACVIASKAYAQGQSICTARAIELVWKACSTRVQPEDMQQFLQASCRELEEIANAIQSGREELFAVERTNMHLDVTTDVNYARKYISTDVSQLQYLAAVVADCRNHLVKVLRGTSGAERHEIENSYTCAKALLLVDLLGGRETV